MIKYERTWLAALTLGVWALVYATVAKADDFKGTWTIRPAEEAGKIYFGLAHRRHGGNSQHESDWPTSAFQGLDLATRARHDVSFTITRDAGRFDCEGFLKDGEGAGTFKFALNPAFVKDMAALGFGGIDDEMQFGMAVHDVSLEFARQMKAERLTGLDTGELIAFRVHGVSQPYIRSLRAEGLSAIDAGKLIAFRVHGVSPEFIEKVASLGYPHPDPDQLVAMRIHGVTPEFISSMKSKGMKDLTIDKLARISHSGADFSR
jgi:hypothetical protein